MNARLFAALAALSLCATLPGHAADLGEPRSVAAAFAAAAGIALPDPREAAAAPTVLVPPVASPAPAKFVAPPQPAPTPFTLANLPRDETRAPAPATPPAMTAPFPAPAWQANAAATPASAGTKPRIAVVIDDVGVEAVNSLRVVALPGPITVSLMTYGYSLDKLAALARNQGDELLIHVPMEPEGNENPGPNVLAGNLAPAELQRRIDWALARVPGVVGINNHMGSKFTADTHGMTALMTALAERGFLFLDSRTTGASVGKQTAQAAGVPYVARDVFLDNEPTPEAVWKQIDEVEAIARRHGSVIAIAHPHGATIQVLRAWLPELEKRGFALVPLSALVTPPSPPTAAVAAR